jgi:NADH pyrophosphatase NudC (nudix superfamily)
MESKPQTQPNPNLTLPRFCGYCGKKMYMNQVEFISHLNDCEKELSERTRRK